MSKELSLEAGPQGGCEGFWVGESFLLGPWNLSLALLRLVQILFLTWFKYLAFLGGPGVELSSGPLGLEDKVGSPQGPSSWASLHLAFWARSSSHFPSPFPPRMTLLLAAVTKHYKLDGLRQQKWILSECWRPESEIQVSAGPSEPLGNPSSRLLGSWWSSQPCNCIMPVSASVVTGHSP